MNKSLSRSRTLQQGTELRAELDDYDGWKCRGPSDLGDQERQVSIPPGFTPGLDPDGNQWLYHTRFRPLDYGVGYFLSKMRAILETTDLDDVDVMEAIPDIDAADVLALTFLPCPVCTTAREFDLASEVGRQLFWRIGERFPEQSATRRSWR